MPTTSGMKGDGFYDEHSGAQRAAIEAHLPLLEAALDAAPLPDAPRPITLVDFGSSEGGNAVPTMARLVARIRARTSQPIVTVFSDLPSNDWNRLATNLRSPRPNVAASRLAEALPAGSVAGGVFPLFAPGSMYERLLPEASVQVATTFNALGWLGEVPPTPVPRFLLAMGPGRERPGVSVSDAERTPFARQAAEDVRRFLSARAAELAPGAKLLVQTFGRGPTARACDGLYDVLSDALLDLVEAGRVARQAYERLVFPVYFRSSEELVAPLAEAASPLAARFRLEASETREVEAPFNRRLRESGDVAAYAAEYTGFLRAFTEPIVRAQILSAPADAEVLDELYERVRARLAADPEGYRFRYVSVAALFTRSAD